jgi:hypothetical protein
MHSITLAASLWSAAATPPPAAPGAPTAGFGSTAGIQTFLLVGVLPLVLIGVALFLIFAGRKQDFSGAATVIGIVLLGCLVLGLSVPGAAVAVGSALSSMVFQ